MIINKKLNSLIQKKRAYLYDYEKDGVLIIKNDGAMHLMPDLTNCSIQAACDFIESPTEMVSSCENGNHVTTDDIASCDGVCMHPQHKNFSNEIKNIYVLDVDLNVLKTKEIFSALCDLIFKKTLFTKFALRFQFCSPFDNRYFDEQLSSFYAHVNANVNKDNFSTILSGPFCEITNQQKRFIIQNNIQLEYVHSLAEENYNFSNETRSTISQIAGMGFRLPIVWYINNTNIDHVVEIIDEAMFLNYNSGFSLPLNRYNILSHKSINDKLPIYEKYLKLLSDVYIDVRFYDDMIFPLNRIMTNSLHLNKRHFWKHYYFNKICGKAIQYHPTKYEIRVENFFTKLFLWQRWKLQNFSKKT